MENPKELFVKAFMEAERLDNSGLPSEDEIEWDFSKEFEKSMEKLIRQNNRIQLSTRRTVTKSLIAAIVAIIVLFTGLMSVAATREPIIEFIKKIFPQYNEITLSENSVVPVDTIKRNTHSPVYPKTLNSIHIKKTIVVHLQYGVIEMKKKLHFHKMF